MNHIRVVGEPLSLCKNVTRGTLHYCILISGSRHHRDIYESVSRYDKEEICPQCYAMVETSLIITALQGEPHDPRHP